MLDATGLVLIWPVCALIVIQRSLRSCQLVCVYEFPLLTTKLFAARSRFPISK